jgi:hypothetical protein
MIKGMRDINKRGEQSNGLQAMRNVQYSSANDYGRTLALSATIAATTDPNAEKKQTMDDMTKEILGNLEAIRKGDTWGPFKAELQKMLDGLGKAIIDGLKGAAYDTGGNALGQVGSTLGQVAVGVLSPTTLIAGRLMGY